MKKLFFLTLIVLIFISGILLTKTPKWQQETSTSIPHQSHDSPKQLNYTFLVASESAQIQFSLDIKDSDWFSHECILNSLIGNLVKYNPSGRIEPYLAEKFFISNDRKIWTYKLRSGQICTDGTPINPKTFVESLHRQLQIYSKKSSPIDFENLKGFKAFKDAQSPKIDGLKFNETEVIFEFDFPPEDLNELLRMPYFGFWCPANFDDKTEKNISTFVSSGPYGVNSNSTSYKIEVDKRANWFSVENESVDKIIFSYSTKSDLNNIRENTIIEGTTTKESIDDSQNLNQIVGLPMLAANLILSPYKNGFFKMSENRRAVLNRIREIQNNHEFYKSKFFFLNAKSAIKESRDSLPTKSNNIKFIEIASVSQKNQRTIDIEQFLNTKFNDTDIQFKFIYPSEELSVWRSKLLTNRSFDSRFGGVANGARPQNFIIKMIFCTELGVHYPDPSGEICKLVKEYEAQSRDVDEDYIVRMNQIIYDDACVIPLFHSSFKWWLTKDLDTNSFPPTVEHPLFEKIRYK